MDGEAILNPAPQPSDDAVEQKVDTPEVQDTPAPQPADTPAPADGKPADSPAPADGDGDKPILEPETPEEEVNEFAGAPENYDDFTMPEGFSLDEAGKTEATELFRKLNLSQKGAQTLVNAWIEKATAMKEAELNQLAEQRKTWRGEIRNRPTFAADRALAQKGINAVVKTDAERALFQDTWLSDHPAVFSLFVRIGSLVGEDSPGPSGKEQTEQNVNRLRFPID
jgi:hypothetical protein